MTTAMKNRTDDVPKQTGTFESFDGTPIYYEIRGEGKPLVFCYGIACLMNHWVHQLKFFSQSYQTIVFDYRGHHKTPTPLIQENLSLDAICRDMDGLLQHLNIESASFCGHSYGVMILLRFFDLFPKSVSNMTFINGFSSNPIKGMFGVDVVAPAFQLFKEGYRNFPATVSSLWQLAITNPVAIKLSALAGGFNLSLASMKDIEVYARGVAALDLNAFITLFDQMMSYDATDVLDRVSVPTLIISGNKDGVTPLSHQIVMHEKIKNSQFLGVPYGSHCTQLDLPDFVNLRIEKFLHELNY